MRCSQARLVAYYYLDRQVSDDQRLQLEAHITRCKVCRDRLELMQTIPTGLRCGRRLTPRPDFTAIIMRKLSSD